MEGKIEQKILRTALLILLLLTLIRVIWSEMLEVKKEVFKSQETEKHLNYQSK